MTEFPQVLKSKHFESAYIPVFRSEGSNRSKDLEFSNMVTIIEGFKFGVPNYILHAMMLMLTHHLHQETHQHFIIDRKISLYTNAEIKFSSENSLIKVTLYGESLESLEVEFEDFISKLTQDLKTWDHLKLRKLVATALVEAGEMGGGTYKNESKLLFYYF